MFQSLGPLPTFGIVFYLVALVAIVWLVVLAFVVGYRYLQWHPAKPKTTSDEQWKRQRWGLDD